MSAIRRAAGGLGERVRAMPRILGAVVLVTFLLTLTVVYNKERIGSLLSSGTTITAEFQQEYKLTSYQTKVKVAGVIVGTVTDVEPTTHGTSMVSMKVQDDAAEKLGSAPDASIRPTLLLGGAYYVDLIPGIPGKLRNPHIPVNRTSLPVELDRVLAAVSPPAQQGLQDVIRQGDATLRSGGQDSARRLLDAAPGTLAPAGPVLEAARGTRPNVDLTDTVSGLQSAAHTLTRKNGQLGNIVDSLGTTTATLGTERQPLADTVRTMPATLSGTESGMGALRGSLDKLTTTATFFRPAAQQLTPLLRNLDPVLARTRPLVSDLRPLMNDAQPLVERLLPTTQQATGALGDLHGPVLDRINGPITKAVLSPWKGTGSYANGGASGHRLYEETGYLLARASQAYEAYDKNGSVARLAPGVGANTPLGGSGFPMSVEQYLELLGQHQPPGPQADAGQGGLPLPLSLNHDASAPSGAPQ